ncbi:MAG: hypothetical protein AAF636_08470 [Pseudomonadota bacterium]
MSSRDLAERLERGRQTRRAAELEGNTAAVANAQREVDKLRKSLFAMDPDERAQGLYAPVVPLACLPVRIETAFMPNDVLRIRVYPDTIHLGGHDPRVTETEVALAQDVAARSATEDETALHAWMDTLVGGGRGAYIRAEVAAGRQVVRKAGAADLPVRAGAMPDHWQATLAWEDQVLNAPFPAMVADPLTLGPSVEDDTALFSRKALSALWSGRSTAKGGLAWMVDFDVALELGMAVEVDLGVAEHTALKTHFQAGGALKSLSVTGLRWAGPEEGAQVMTELIEGHAIQREAQIAPQGSATNNDGDYRTSSVASHQGGPNMVRLGRVLGLSETAMARLGDVPLDEDLVASQTAVALWPGMAGLYGEALLGLDADAIEPFRELYRDGLRARGHLPVLRIGKEPYGVLPLQITPNGNADPVPATAFEDAVARRVNVLRKGMRRRSLRLEAPEDYESWLTLFGTEAHPSTLMGLPFGRVGRAGTHAAEQLLDDLDLPEAKDVLADVTAIETLIEVSPRLPMSYYPADAQPRTDRVAREVLGVESLGALLNLLPPDRWPVQAWREMPFVRRLTFRNGSRQIIQDGFEAGDPITFTLIRHALFSHFAALMRAAVVRMGETPARLTAPDQSPEVVPLIDQFVSLTGLEPDALTLPLDKRVARQLRLPEVLVFQNKELAQALPLLARLEEDDPDAFELALREQMALVSYRPDAWAAALDAAKLDRLRATRRDGLLIGGYGRVFGLKPGAGRKQGGEALLARSFDHAMTAAALREGLRKQRKAGAGPDAFAVNLSSERVGPAQEVLGALRAGRSLSAILGQRIEQGLRRELSAQPAVLNETIEALRAAFPLREGVRKASADAAKGADTCDGIKVLEALETDPGAVPQAARAQAEAARVVTEAIADLGLAEAVHGMISAGPERSGAALDMLSRGESVPEVFEVAEDRRSGAGLALTVSILGKARSVPTLSATPDLGTVSQARAIAAGPLAGILQAWIGPLSAYGYWSQTGQAAAQWQPLDKVPLDPMAVVFSTRHPDNLVDTDRAGPDGQPSYDQTRVLFGMMRTLLADGRAMGTEEPGSGFAVDKEDENARRAHVAALARSVRDALETGAEDALIWAEAFGREDAVVTDLGPTESAAHMGRVAQRLRQDLDAFEAGARYETLFGSALPTAPVLAEAPLRVLRERLQGATALRTAHGAAPLTQWLRDAAATRPRLASMMQTAEACEALRDETVLTFQPHQSAQATGWAGIKAQPGTPVSQAGLIVGDVASPHGGIVIDGWSEILPDTHAEAAVALEVQTPKSRAPQAIMLVLSDEVFSEASPLAAMDRLFALMAERALSPADMGDALRLPPVMSFQEPLR